MFPFNISLKQKYSVRKSITGSAKEMEKLSKMMPKRPEETNHVLEITRTVSARRIASPTEEIARNKTESTKVRQVFTEEVSQNKQSQAGHN